MSTEETGRLVSGRHLGLGAGEPSTGLTVELPMAAAVEVDGGGPVCGCLPHDSASLVRHGGGPGMTAKGGRAHVDQPNATDLTVGSMLRSTATTDRGRPLVYLHTRWRDPMGNRLSSQRAISGPAGRGGRVRFRLTPLVVPLIAMIAAAALQMALVPSALAGSAGANVLTWNASVAPMPATSYALAAATGGDGRIYAIGGFSSGYSSVVNAYTPSLNSWTTAASLPVGTANSAAATGPDGRIYVIGGDTSLGGVSSAVYAYTPSSNTWATEAPLPTTTEILAAATGPDGRIYAIGGYNGSAVSSAVYAYTPSSNTWTTVAPLPAATDSLAAATGPDGRIYAIGGYNGTADSSAVYAYTPSSNTWTTAAPLPAATDSLAAATGPDGRIYAMGGVNSGGYSSAVYAYTPSSNAWTTVASLPVATAFLAAATGPDGRIYAMGGVNSGGYSSAVYAYTAPVASATQQTSVTVANGTLSVSNLLGAVAFGTLRPGVSSGAMSAGEIDYVNTLNDGSAWSATVAATDLVSGGATIPFTAMTYSPGQTVSNQASGNPAPATNSSVFSGSDPSPGTSFSTAVTLVNGASTAQGTFAQTGSTVTLVVPAGAQALSYYGTLQYTIIG